MRPIICCLLFTLSCSTFCADNYVPLDDDMLEEVVISPDITESSLSVADAKRILTDLRWERIKYGDKLFALGLLALLSICAPDVVPGMILFLIGCLDHCETKDHNHGTLTKSVTSNNYTERHGKNGCGTNGVLHSPGPMCVTALSLFGFSGTLIAIVPTTAVTIAIYNRWMVDRYNKPLDELSAELSKIEDGNQPLPNTLVRKLGPVCVRANEAAKLLSLEQVFLIAEYDQISLNQLVEKRKLSKPVHDAFCFINELKRCDKTALCKTLSVNEIREYFLHHPVALHHLTRGLTTEMLNDAAIQELIWPNQDKTEITLIHGERTENLNKASLERISDFFLALPAFKQTAFVRLNEDLDDNSVDVLKLMALGGMPDIACDNLFALLFFAQYYQIAKLKEACDDYLYQKEEIPPCVLTEFIAMYGLTENKRRFAVELIFCRHFDLPKLRTHFIQGLAKRYRESPETESVNQDLKCLNDVELDQFTHLAK